MRKTKHFDCRSALASGLIMLGSFSASTMANAANVIDQNQPINPFNMASFAQNPVQSFQQTSSNISGAGVFLTDNSYGIATITISLWDKLPNVAGANMLISASQNLPIGSPEGWLDVYWSPKAIAPATSYFLAFTSSISSIGVKGIVSDVYALGNMFALPMNFPSWDYSFRTYSNDVAGAVPEPASWAMLIAGFGLVGAVARRSRRVAAHATAA